MIKRQGTRRPENLLLGKNHSVVGLLARDIANHSYTQNSMNIAQVVPYNHGDAG